MTIEKPADIHDAVATLFNARDLDGLVALYEPDARMVGLDGSVSEGSDAIRENWKAILEFGGEMALTTNYTIEQGDVALISNDYTLTIGDDVISGRTAEVVRRQADGSWLYIIDHPTAAAVPTD
jgi:uncharacterized protein (TIGR02246 family)